MNETYRYARWLFLVFTDYDVMSCWVLRISVSMDRYNKNA